MGILDSSTLSITNLEPTTSTLSGNSLTGTTTVGGTTTTGVFATMEKDKEGKYKVVPKKLAVLLGTMAGTSTSMTSVNMRGIDAEFKEQATNMGITEEQTAAVNQIRNAEEWFGSLSDEEQLTYLAKINQKQETLKNVDSQGKSYTKHL